MLRVADAYDTKHRRYTARCCHAARDSITPTYRLRLILPLLPLAGSYAAAMKLLDYARSIWLSATCRQRYAPPLTIISRCYACYARIRCRGATFAMLLILRRAATPLIQ